VIRVRVQLLINLIYDTLKENLALNYNRFAMNSPFNLSVRYYAGLGAKMLIFEG
jgi:hypothetical protein